MRRFSGSAVLGFLVGAHPANSATQSRLPPLNVRGFLFGFALATAALVILAVGA
jgi:hypothetical protein